MEGSEFQVTFFDEWKGSFLFTVGLDFGQLIYQLADSVQEGKLFIKFGANLFDVIRLFGILEVGHSQIA